MSFVRCNADGCVEYHMTAIRLPRRVVRKIGRLFGIKRLPELDPRLSQMERIFRAPPLTRKLRAAIKRISPQFDLRKRDRLFGKLMRTALVGLNMRRWDLSFAGTRRR